MIEIIPTVVPASFSDIASTVARYPFARSIHVDFADGQFAPNTTWLPKESDAPYGRGSVILEAHLMCAQPRAIGELLACGGFSRIIGHVEAMNENVAEMFSAWKAAGARECGLGVLFATPIEMLEPYAKSCDVVQMMSIGSIGVQGIPYEPSAPARIATLHALHPSLLIADDGGVGENNIEELAHAGVSRFCVGSALSRSTDPESTYGRLHSLAEGAVQ